MSSLDHEIPLVRKNRTLQNQWEKAVEEELNNPIDIYSGPLWRCTCFCSENDVSEGEIIFTFHHSNTFQEVAMQKVRGRPKAAAPSVEQVKAEIKQRAKEIFQKREETKEAGDALSDWLKAEKQIKAKYRLS